MTRPWTLAALGFAGLTFASISGCSSFARGDDRAASIDGIAGPQERAIKQVAYAEGNLAGVVDDPALRQGQALYDAARYEEAEEVYRGVLKKFGTDLVTKVIGGGGAIGRGTSRKAFDMYGSAVEETAQFMLAESLFMQGKFTDATDAYETLVQRYPSTRHLDALTRRQFIIARTWLGFAPDKEVKSGGNIELAGYTTASAVADPKTAPEKPSFINLTDGSRPTFDTAGRALQILSNIWINDPTGPLADDALMLIGNFEYRRGDLIEAARHYEILREQYPESAHIDNAFLLESHVRLASYDGPTYDADNLERAAQLKQQALIELDLPTGQRKRIQQELNQIEDERARREWAKVQQYRRQDATNSVKFYCNKILNVFPESSYAPLAKQMLQQLADEQRGSRFGWFIKSAPDGPKPRANRGELAQSPQLRQGIPPSLVPPSPDPEPEPEAPPARRPLRSEPFPSREQYAPPPSQTPSEQQYIQAGYESTKQPAIKQTAAVDQPPADDGANPFESFQFSE